MKLARDFDLETGLLHISFMLLTNIYLAWNPKYPLAFCQENSRIFAGKQIHPFFSSCKTSKKNQEVTDLESNQFAAGRDKKEITCGPIHVFERTQVRFSEFDSSLAIFAVAELGELEVCS